MFWRSMIFDRPYMRDQDERPPLSALKWLMVTLVAAFVIENVCLGWFGGDFAALFFRSLTLSPEGIKTGFVWSLLTHGLLHDPKNLFNLLFTLLAIFIFGRAVIPEIGPKRFLQVFVAAVILGGLTWLAVNWTGGERLFGASAGVSALIVLFACLNPAQPIAFFMIDVGMRAKHLAFGLLCIDVLGLVLLEIPGRSSWFNMAHSAHLGGMAAGWLYFRATRLSEAPLFNSKPAIELPRWFRRSRKTTTPAPAFKVNLGGGADFKAEVDRILDKINSHGFQSLSTEEKRRLDQARDLLNHRR
jgi:membrane associated rhomboid family serine protease